MKHSRFELGVSILVLLNCLLLGTEVAVRLPFVRVRCTSIVSCKLQDVITLVCVVPMWLYES